MSARRTRPGRVLVGTSGWLYPHWRGVFFPPKLRRESELAFVAQRFPTVEINGTFYSMTRPSCVETWRAAVPPGFVFAVKASRYITHMLKLRNFETALGNFFAQGILRFGTQLGPILWQLPPMLPYDRARAEGFFGALPRDVAGAERWARRHDARVTGRCALKAPDGRDRPLRHVVEVRHPTWLCDESLALLERLDVALVAADTAGKHPFSLARTASFAYARLHGSSVLYTSQYTDEEIETWAERVRGWRDGGSDVYVYFDNDAKVHAPGDAQRLIAAVESRGRAPRHAAPGLASAAPVTTMR